MLEPRDGQIVTFYSFKGGTGRSMALANVAWILAACGKRVLAVDWDLESPGLPRYFSPFLNAEGVRDAPGVIDMIREFASEAERRRRRDTPFDDVAGYARVSQYVTSLEWQFPDGGTLDFMSCGRQNLDYSSTIGSLGWDNFYEQLKGGRLFTALRAEMKNKYDYTLIDSRTGFSDIASICTAHLPDTLVDCFTLNTQGIEGAVRIATEVSKFRVAGTGEPIRVLPVPMRVENAEKVKADTGRNLARRRFDQLPSGLTDRQRDDYWASVAIPYQPFYAYEETLAAFGDSRSGPTTLLGAYERLTAYVTDGAVASMPPMDTALRERWLRRFERSMPSEVAQVLLDYEPEDEAWAEWAERVLAEVKIQVMSARSTPAKPDGGPTPMVLTIVSKSSPQDPRTTRPLWRSADNGHGSGDHRAIYIADVRSIDGFPVGDSEHLAGKSATEAVNLLTGLVGCDAVPEDAMLRLAEHYPGNEPTINNAPIRNQQFTGRADALRQLREKLREHRVASVIPLNMPGGIGKTQLAIEYVHRYKSNYEVIWWIRSGQPQFIDTDLVDLGTALTERYETPTKVGAGATAEEEALAVSGALGQGQPVRRWLLVFDNAEDPAAVRKFIPAGTIGHVLVTSRNRAWEQATATVDVGVFERSESIAHLRQRTTAITESDADALAQALGDLPLAVSFTGAWLKETGTSVAEHVRSLDQRGALAIPDESLLLEYPDTLVKVLDSSLQEVRARSRAAYRLIQLCSFMSGESIALGLVYSPAMVKLLEPFDPTLTEPNDIAKHVQQLNRLALIKLDNHNQQFSVHVLLQARAQQQLGEKQLADARHQVHELLAANRPRRDVDDPETWQRYRMLWPHLDPSQVAHCQTELVRTLMVDRVRYMWTRGPLDLAAATGRDIEQLWQEHLNAVPAGEDDAQLRKQLLHLRFNLANILRAQAKYEEAWELDTKVLAEQRSLLGADHRHTLMTSTGLAADLRARGRYREAIELAEETYTAWNLAYGEDFPRTLDAAHNLSISYRLAGRYAHARALDEVTYERRRTNLGEEHPRTLNSASAIGRDLREAGRYPESVVWLRDLLTSARGYSEQDPRAIAEIEVNLAASLRAAGRFTEATPYIDAALNRLKSLYETDHADILICRLCRAANLLAADEFGQADQELRSVLVSYRRLVGPDHPITLVAASNHVAVLRLVKAHEEALNTARDTVDRLRAGLGREFPYTLAAEMNLATCLADVQRLDESRALDEETSQRLAELLGAEHPDALRAAANLNLTLKAQGEPGAAAALDRIIDRLGQSIGFGHPSVSALQNENRTHRVLDPQPF